MLLTMKFYLQENKRTALVIIFMLAFSVLLLGLMLPAQISFVSGTAKSFYYNNSETGNVSMLQVSLSSNKIANIKISAINGIKINDSVCLQKKTTYLGAVSYSHALKQYCT